MECLNLAIQRAADRGSLPDECFVTVCPVIYIFCIDSEQRSKISAKLDVHRYFTHVLPESLPAPYPKGNVALLFVRYGKEGEAGTFHRLDSLGLIFNPRGEKIATFGRRVKVDFLLPPGQPIDLEALKRLLPRELDTKLTRAVELGAYPLKEEEGTRVLQLLAGLSAHLAEIIDYFGSLRNRDQLEVDRPEDAPRWEERDGLRVVTRISGMFSPGLNAWRRPEDQQTPYMAGLIREPTEQSMIEYDVRHPVEWAAGVKGVNRYDIRVLGEGDRCLEVVNVNATKVESRLGTDLIYYHHGTRSFVLVQYKRLSQKSKLVWVDERLRGQLEHLEEVAELGSTPEGADDWRLNNDPCFLKLAHWEPKEEQSTSMPSKGLYLPVSYVRLLLEDDRTMGPNGGVRLGYETVPRYLANSEFIELVKNGLVGTVGTSLEDLNKLVTKRVRQGKGVLIAMESGSETTAQRQARQRSRGGKRGGRRRHSTEGMDTLF